MFAVAAISAAAPTEKSVDKKVTDADRDKRGVFGEHHEHSFQQSQSLELTQGYSYERPQQQEYQQEYQQPEHQPEQQGYSYEHQPEHHEHVRTQYVHVPQPYPVEKVVEKIVHVDRPVEKIVHVPQVFLML